MRTILNYMSDEILASFLADLVKGEAMMTPLAEEVLKAKIPNGANVDLKCAVKAPYIPIVIEKVDGSIPLPLPSSSPLSAVRLSQQDGVLSSASKVVVGQPERLLFGRKITDGPVHNSVWYEKMGVSDKIREEIQKIRDVRGPLYDRFDPLRVQHDDKAIQLLMPLCCSKANNNRLERQLLKGFIRHWAPVDGEYRVHAHGEEMWIGANNIFDAIFYVAKFAAQGQTTRVTLTHKPQTSSNRITSQLMGWDKKDGKYGLFLISKNGKDFGHPLQWGVP